MLNRAHSSFLVQTVFPSCWLIQLVSPSPVHKRTGRLRRLISFINAELCQTCCVQSVAAPERLDKRCEFTPGCWNFQYCEWLLLTGRNRKLQYTPLSPCFGGYYPLKFERASFLKNVAILHHSLPASACMKYSKGSGPPGSCCEDVVSNSSNSRWSGAAICPPKL